VLGPTVKPWGTSDLKYARSARTLREMRDDLMPEKLKIDPVIAGSSLGAAKQTAIEGARGG